MKKITKSEIIPHQDFIFTLGKEIIKSEKSKKSELSKKSGQKNVDQKMKGLTKL